MNTAEILMTNTEQRSQFNIPKKHFVPTSSSSLIGYRGVAIGEGLNHKVYRVEEPGKPKQVVKVPKASTQGMMVNSQEHEVQNATLVKKFFGGYAVPTEVVSQNGSYALVQDFIEGNSVTSHTTSTKVRAQITDIMRLNREMMRQTGRSLDFLGAAGTLGWAKYQIRKIFDKNSEFTFANLMVDPQEQIHIIDNDTFQFSGVPPLQWITSHLSFFVNRLAMHWYFGVDMKGT